MEQETHYPLSCSCIDALVDVWQGNTPDWKNRECSLNSPLIRMPLLVRNSCAIAIHLKMKNTFEFKILIMQVSL